jgi:hypothetical protein
MKTKLSKILGVGLALVLVFTLAFALVPTKDAEAQAYTPNQWNAMPVPSFVAGVLAAGSTIVDFDVSADGNTIYALTGLGAGFRIAKSSTAGRMWAYVNEPVWINAPGSFIRVAPDDPETVVVTDTATNAVNEHVFLSKNGGSTWADLGDPVASATGAARVTSVISDVEVSPMVATNILERDVIVSTYNTDNCQANPYTAGANWGDIYMVGPTLAWGSQAVAAGANYDWTSIDLSSNWVGQRAVIGVGSDNVAAGNTEVGNTGTSGTTAFPGDTYLVAFNVNPVVGPAIIAPTPVNMDTGTYDSPSEIKAAAAAQLNGEIVSSSVVVPSDFDSASVAQFTAYLGWTSVQLAGVITNGDDVYRVDFNSPRKLQIRSTIAIYSVDYTGTCMSGTLYAGERHKTAAFLPIGVWFTDNPTSGLPSWSFSYKTPTSTATLNTNCKILVSPANSSVVFGGCATGPDTAFSLSEDGGVSFNGIALVDDVIDAMPDVMPTPAGEYVFLATANLTSNNQSLWRCANVPATGAWERVGFVTPAAANGFTAPTSIIRIDPEWAVDGSQTLYWVGTAGGTNILKSPNNGQIWVTRTAGAAAVADVAVESADMLYMIETTNVYASTSGGWSFGLPNNPGLGGLLDIAMAPDYPKLPVAGHVLVGGGTGIVALSMASAAIGSFIPLSSAPATGNMQVCADKDYADNSIIYAISANTTATGVGIYRYQFGVSSAWELIDTTAAGNDTGTGIVSDCGILYGCYTDYARSTVSRLFYSTAGVADIQIDAMNIGAVGVVFDSINNRPNALRICGTDTENRLYAVDITGTDTLYSYQDTIAKISPAPAVSSEIIPYDPNANGSAQFTITWPAISNATAYEVFFFTDAACTNFFTAITTAGAAPATAYLPAIAGSPAVTIPAATLNAGTDYWLLMRVRNEVTLDQIRGPWSAPVKISVEPGVPVQAPNIGPTLLSPQAGATNVSLDTGFNWTPIAGATSYEFILATDSALTNTIGGTPVTVSGTAWEAPAGTLAFDTTYFWGVRVNAPTVGPQSTGSFITAAESAAKAAATPLYIWIVIAIGAILVIAVIWLIFSTRRA